MKYFWHRNYKKLADLFAMIKPFTNSIRKTNYALLVACVCFFTGCKPDKIVEDPYQDHTMPKEMYDYGYFLPGTYWVYEDSVSGAIDSVWVWDAYKGRDTLGRSNSSGLDEGIYDWFKIKTRSSYFNADYYYWSNSSRAAKSYSFPVYREILSSSMLAETPCLRFHYELGKIYYGYSSVNSVDTQRCSAFFNSLILASNSFYSVIVYEQTKNYLEEDNHTYFYWAKNYGLIRKEILGKNEVWNLIRCNIIQ